MKYTLVFRLRQGGAKFGLTQVVFLFKNLNGDDFLDALGKRHAHQPFLEIGETLLSSRQHHKILAHGLKFINFSDSVFTKHSEDGFSCHQFIGISLDFIGNASFLFGGSRNPQRNTGFDGIIR